MESKWRMKHTNSDAIAKKEDSIKLMDTPKKINGS
jgi:hypothetical protein